MTIAGSIFLIAVGAILRFATNLHVAHVDLHTVGLILMIAGVAGLILGFVQQRMWARRTAAGIPADRVAPIEEDEVPPERRY
jgi:Domain of unknown function (DUF6458)